MTLNYSINSLTLEKNSYEAVQRENNALRQLTGLLTLIQLTVKPLTAKTQYQFAITTDLILVSLWAFYPKNPGGQIQLTQLDAAGKELRTLKITSIESEFNNTVDISFFPYILPKDSFLRVSTLIDCNEILIIADPVLVQTNLKGERMN